MKYNFVLIILCFFLLQTKNAFTQSFDLNQSWQSLGPEDKPDSPTNISASGVGPIEFIRVFKSAPENLLAGSISGGLFYSTDGGENWINSGSDEWDYSGCGWADFYPGDSNIWFAYSNLSGNNGKPGIMGRSGGIMRTMNGGLTWEKIGVSSGLSGNDYCAVYGFRFLPFDPKVMFVLTDDGMFYTSNCLEANVSWKKSDFTGMIYDMDFINNQAYVTVQSNKKWSLFEYSFDQNEILTIDTLSRFDDEIRAMTIEPNAQNLLVLVDFAKKNDELWSYSSDSLAAKKLTAGLQVNFGSGHTFAINPHNNCEVIVGHATTMKKFNLNSMREKKMKHTYHVDVEFVHYHPTDSNVIYIACHGGVYKTIDQGETWISLCNGLGVAEVMGMAVSETDPEQIVIGTFHDGSSVRADFNKDGNYFWRTVNGGDALTPLIDPLNPAIIYTSTQFIGGGLYYSKDTCRSLINIHSKNGVNTPGWELSATLHPVHVRTVFVNYARKENQKNFDLIRIRDASVAKSAEVISNFEMTHQLSKYKVYGVFNSSFYPNELLVYVLHYDQDENGKNITRHRLFKNENALDTAQKVIDSWYELEVPLNTWMGDVEADPNDNNIYYISYADGQNTKSNPALSTGLVYAVKYHKKTKKLKKQIDISAAIPSGVGGRFNMCFTKNGELFFATRSGVYFADKKVLKGKAMPQKVGHSLPHCKVYGLHYHEDKKILTVGLLGRGVWRYYF